ncbi:hypothetical protein [uncultured Tenacibaculum sp.]|uniref:hypothetical protein n=1 Tax=uncultured Tenacibaculum sp. TaxID=174713 RepID=UPI00261827BC|nr:hypothetical protein [uncultured Tenacibaculum sp.]
MNKKFLLSIALTILVSSFGFAQKVKFKKGKVLVDGKEILKIERQGTEATLYSLEGDDEVIYLNYESNGTLHYHEDDYVVIFFSKEEIKVETSRIKGSRKRVIKALIKNKVLDMNGEINLEKLKKFAKKYDENITNRTVRY